MPHQGSDQRITPETAPQATPEITQQSARRFHIFTASMCLLEAFFAAEFAIVPAMAAVPNKRWWVITLNATFFSVLGGVIFFGFGWGFASAFEGQVFWGYTVGSVPALLDTHLWALWFEGMAWQLAALDDCRLCHLYRCPVACPL